MSSRGGGGESNFGLVIRHLSVCLFFFSSLREKNREKNSGSTYYIVHDSRRYTLRDVSQDVPF